MNRAVWLVLHSRALQQSVEFTTCCAQAARQGAHLIEGLTVGKVLGQGFQVTPQRAAVYTPFAVCDIFFLWYFLSENTKHQSARGMSSYQKGRASDLLLFLCF